MQSGIARKTQGVSSSRNPAAAAGLRAVPSPLRLSFLSLNLLRKDKAGTYAHARAYIYIHTYVRCKRACVRAYVVCTCIGRKREPGVVGDRPRRDGQKRRMSSVSREWNVCLRCGLLQRAIVCQSNSVRANGGFGSDYVYPTTASAAAAAGLPPATNSSRRPSLHATHATRFIGANTSSTQRKATHASLARVVKRQIVGQTCIPTATIIMRIWFFYDALL
jgi:hypothetical protein